MRALTRPYSTKGHEEIVVDEAGRSGRDLFRVACDHDLEGIVGKLAHSPYVEQPPPWTKVLNPLHTEE